MVPLKQLIDLSQLVLDAAINDKMPKEELSKLIASDKTYEYGFEVKMIYRLDSDAVIYFGYDLVFDGKNVTIMVSPSGKLEKELDTMNCLLQAKAKCYFSMVNFFTNSKGQQVLLHEPIVPNENKSY